MSISSQAVGQSPSPQSPSYILGSSHPRSGYAFKGLGQGGSQQSELANWYKNEFYPYYRKVLSGEVQVQDQAQWQEILASAEWAYDQLYGQGGGGFAPMGDGGSDFSDPFAMDESDSAPAGAIAGPHDNWVYNGESATIDFVGDPRLTDSWAEDNVLRVASRSAKVTYELTLDARSNPPTQVLKAIVKDPATGAESTYYFHNWADPDFRLKIQVPDQSQVTGTATLSGITVGKYSDASTEQAPETSTPGEETANHEWVYEANAGETIDVNSQPNGVEGEEHKHWLYSDSINLSTRFTDEVAVSPGNPKDPLGHTVVVKHRDGSIDIYYLPAGAKTNLNARYQNITWGQLPKGSVEKVPTEFKAAFTLNASAEETGAGIYENDTQPDETEGDTAHYNTSPDVELHANYDDDIHLHRISAPGKVIIHGHDYSDTMQVAYNAATHSWTVVVYKGGDLTQMEVYDIKGGPNTQVILDVMGENQLVGTSDEAIDSVQVGLNGEAPGAEGSGAGRAKEISELEGIELSANEIQAEADQLNLDLKYPPTPNATLFQFLYKIDPVLQHLLDDVRNGGRKDILGTQIRDRLVTLLQTLYPNANVMADGGGENNGDDILFAGQQFDIFDQDKSATHAWDYLRLTTSDT